MADQERPICGAHDNDNPYIECALPLGHDGPHCTEATPASTGKESE